MASPLEGGLRGVLFDICFASFSHVLQKMQRFGRYAVNTLAMNKNEPDSTQLNLKSHTRRVKQSSFGNFYWTQLIK